MIKPHVRTTLDVRSGNYVENTKMLNEWHQRMKNQLLLSSFWMSISFMCVSFTIVQSYRYAKGTHTDWLITSLSLIMVFSLFEQIICWRWNEHRRIYTLSIVKDLLITCRQRTVLRLILFIIYMLTYLSLLVTAYLFYNNCNHLAALNLLIYMVPLGIVLTSLCIYNAIKCTQHLRQFNQLLKQVPSQEN